MAPDRMEPFLKEVVREEPFIQFLAIVSTDGLLVSHVYAQRGEKALFRQLFQEDFSDHDWFVEVKETGQPFYSDLYISRYTGALTLTVAHPIFSADKKLLAVVDVDFKFEELTKLLNRLPQDILEAETHPDEEMQEA
jgi:hypothetical protein